MKKLILTILFCLMMGNWAWAATAFNVSVAPSGGDYSTLEGIFNATGTIDLTSAATKVFTITGGITGTMSDNTAVTGVTSGATGTCVHASGVGNQILIKSITGTFQSGEIVYETLGTNYVTLSNAGASPTINVNISGTWASADTTAVFIQNITSSATNNVVIATSGSAVHPGYYSNASPYYRLVLNENGSGVLNISSANVSITGVQMSNTNTVNSNSGAIRLSASNFTGDRLICISNSNTANGNSPAFYEQTNNLTYTIKNSVFIGHANDGADTAGGTVKFYNCIFVSGGGSGYNKSLGSGSTSTLINCYATGTVSGFVQGSGTLSITTSASSDGSRSTTTVAYSTSTGAKFTNVTAGSENFTLTSGSSLISAGTNESGVFTDDIIGATRQASGAWDIGAFYYASSAPVNNGFTRFL